MGRLNRRQFVHGAGAVLGSALVGCGRRDAQSVDSTVIVFVNGTVLPVDAASAKL